MRTRICFVALGAYPLLAGINSKNVIGHNVHTVLLARELLKHNFDITFVTYDEGGPPIEHIGGIKIIKTYRSADIPRLNPVLKALGIWRAMRKAKAHIYFAHGGASGVVPLFCRLMKTKSVWHIASDPYVLKGLKNFKLLDRFGIWLDIKLANVIIAMNEFQTTMLKKSLGRDSSLIKHHFPLTPRGMPEKTKPPIVLWVGSMAEAKQPELLLSLAEAIPEVSFRMIGGVSAELRLYNRVKEASERIPNLDFLDVVPFSEINEYYSRAAILLNTSKFESYPPYAFIQAWMNYTPVVTLNSNTSAAEIMYRYKLGFHSKTFQQLKQDVRTLLKNEQLRQQMGENGQQYVEENHDIRKIVKQHIEVFNQLVKPK